MGSVRVHRPLQGHSWPPLLCLKALITMLAKYLPRLIDNRHRLGTPVSIEGTLPAQYLISHQQCLRYYRRDFSVISLPLPIATCGGIPVTFPMQCCIALPLPDCKAHVCFRYEWCRKGTEVNHSKS